MILNSPRSRAYKYSFFYKDYQHKAYFPSLHLEEPLLRPAALHDLHDHPSPVTAGTDPLEGGLIPVQVRAGVHVAAFEENPDELTLFHVKTVSLAKAAKAAKEGTEAEGME